MYDYLADYTLVPIVSSQQKITKSNESEHNMQSKVEPPNRNELKITFVGDKSNQSTIMQLRTVYKVSNYTHEMLMPYQVKFRDICAFCGQRLEHDRITITIDNGIELDVLNTLITGGCCTDVVYSEPSTDVQNSESP